MRWVCIVSCGLPYGETGETSFGDCSGCVIRILFAYHVIAWPVRCCTGHDYLRTP